MLSAKKTSMEINYTIPNNEKTVSVCDATIDDIPEIIRFISAEQPYWLRFSSEHELKTAIEIVPDSIIISRDNDNAICGLVTFFPVDGLLVISYALVRKSLRRLGLGALVGPDILRKFADKNAVLSSCDAMRPVYMKYGFKDQARQSFWSGSINKKKINTIDVKGTAMIRKVKQKDVENVVDYDKGLHPYDREWFVKERIVGTDGQLAYVAHLDSQVVGYGYIKRPTQNNYGIVLFSDNEKIARQLLSRLIEDIPDDSMLFLVVPGSEENPCSQCLAEDIGLQKDSEHTMMYMKYPVAYQWRKTFLSDLPFLTLT